MGSFDCFPHNDVSIGENSYMRYLLLLPACELTLIEQERLRENEGKGEKEK